VRFLGRVTSRHSALPARSTRFDRRLKQPPQAGNAPGRGAHFIPATAAARASASGVPVANENDAYFRPNAQRQSNELAAMSARVKRQNRRPAMR
jgi:hypothetical protein